MKALGTLSKEQAAEFEKSNEAFRRLEAESRKAAAGVGAVAEKSKQIPKELDNAGKSMGNAVQGADKLGESFKRMGGALLAAFGVTSGILMFANLVKSMVDVNKDFEFQMAKVKAVTAATDEEFQRLSENARKLGATTKFTATEVGQLSEEYAKLGFTTDEIIDASEATLLLAEATGTDLANAASVAGSVVRAYGLDADQTARVTDVMAKSFAIAALDIGDFSEAMKYVGPIAKAANIDVETTTALLAKLSDSGLRGSIAGTGLKNLLSKLSDGSSELSKEIGFTVKNSDDLFKAFTKLKDGNVDLTKATELTDERSKAAFLTLIQGADDLRGLTDELYNAEGATLKMAEAMRDTLTGDLDALSSAWEAFQLQLGNTSGLRTATQWLTAYLQLTMEILKTQEQVLESTISMNVDAGAKSAKDFSESIAKVRADMELLEEAGKAVPNSGLLMAISATEKKIAEVTVQYEKFQSVVVAQNEKMAKSGLAMLTQSQIDELPKGLRKAAQAAKDSFDQSRIFAAKYGAELSGLRDVLTKLKTESEGIGGGDETAKAVRSLDTLEAALKTTKEAFQEAEIGSRGFIKAEKEMRDKAKEISEVLSQFLVKGSLPEMAYQVKLLRDEQDRLADSDAWQVVEGKIIALNKQIAAFKDMTKAGTLGALEKALADLKAKESELATPEAWKVWQSEVRVLELQIKGLRGELGKMANDFVAERTGTDFTKSIRAEEAAYNEVFEAINAIKTTSVEEEAERNDLAEQARLAHQKAMLDITAQYLGKEVVATKAAEKEKKGARDQAIQEYIQVSGAAIQGIFDMQSRFFQYELDALDRQLAAGQVSRETYDTKRSNILRKQAESEKQAALFKAIVNVAAAVATALTAGPVAGQILAGITATLGSIEIATILSQPIPQFAVGTKSAPAGFKWVGERGAELVYDGGGYPIITNKESQVISNDPYSPAAATIRAKYDIPKLDVGLFQPSISMALSNSAKEAAMSSASRGKDGIDYDRLVAAMVTSNSYDDRELVREVKEHKRIDREGYQMLTNAMRRQRRGGYA
jgi:TP901 family phage tail tape measure protein